MRSLSPTHSHLRLMLRSALFLFSAATYIVSPEDVIWRFIKASPHARVLEHLAFGLAAILLGTALHLRVRTSFSEEGSPAQAKLASLLQSIGLGFLLPLPGFLLLVFGQLGIDSLSRERQPTVPEEPRDLTTNTWAGALAAHIGLCCAFASMVIFSIVLVDRVGDVLFATSALISLGANARRALRPRPRRS